MSTSEACLLCGERGYPDPACDPRTCTVAFGPLLGPGEMTALARRLLVAFDQAAQDACESTGGDRRPWQEDMDYNSDDWKDLRAEAVRILGEPKP